MCDLRSYLDIFRVQLAQLGRADLDVVLDGAASLEELANHFLKSNNSLDVKSVEDLAIDHLRLARPEGLDFCLSLDVA